MPLPHHTHTFTLEPATKEEVKEGLSDSKALAPVSVGSAAAYSVNYFATAAQGKKADDAVAKRDIGALAYKDKATVYDIEASGYPGEETLLSGAGWVTPSSLEVGDMKASLYDPDNIRLSAFSMENMSEGPTKKILSEEERLKLQWLSSLGPTIEKWHAGDEGINYPISPVDLKNTIHYFSLSKSLGMSKSVYDPQKVGKDAFDMDNMREGEKHFILTAEERIQIAEIEAIKEGIHDAKETAECGVHTAHEAKEAADSALSIAKGAETKAVDAQTTAQGCASIAGEAKETAESAFNRAEKAEVHASEAQAIATIAQSTAQDAQDSISTVKETADKAKETADKVQEKVDLMQAFEQQDWINGTKTEGGLISPVHLLASIQAHSSNSSGGGSCSCNGALKPIEILMTESGEIPWPEGITDETELEIWAWGGGNAGVSSSVGCGGAGGCCTYVRTRKKFLGKSSVKIGRGGRTDDDHGGRETKVGQFIIALGGASLQPHQTGGFDGENAELGAGGDGFLGGNGGNGGLGGKGGDNGGRGGHGGDNFLSNGGKGGNGGLPINKGNCGNGGDGGDSVYGGGGLGGMGGNGFRGGNSGNGGWGGKGGRGGSSIYGGGGGGGRGGRSGGNGGDGGDSIYGGGGGGGGHGGGRGGNGGGSMWGGKGGRGGNGVGGGGGGYFPGKDATSSSSGDGGDGAVLIKVYL
ncbi:hypothetical protein [Bartonella sp. AR 15-3]|uniref:hypothetical protein n=1 Tax=Bartonella sp. AR 15-3 TaxID=545617 RepID=UPI0001F4C240|nr:hypothetical protein [Bartonella sp. AR 15-3]OPB31572.1 hypothetical protein BAR153v2_005210 [Bartonella sp. AR 15-3]CBI79410.1 conserved hypothetical protein [Bartonella sp. AR 15-3]